ncbi:hypothetical protein J5N97_017850 [Dioscorea zingiberensis]|uniref:Endonuclease/exonuclease/phosphatase domain-containing protein n=1 Tax=Dioscorea zingiberensis TaxID=325984 RepID=A0A9D5HGR5_9LILI|nr:hypothetical protein J5N97_017850 [Dioscorea zingiberensis]
MESIKLICWNCRGVSNSATISRIKSIIRMHQPDLVCLVETRADADRAYTFCKKFAKRWHWAAIPAQGMSRGIVVLWKHNIGLVTPFAISKYSLHLVISADNPKEWVLTVVYNSQRLQVQKSHWLELETFSSLELPWILVGDFNAIRNSEEHRGGGFNHYSSKSKCFNDFITDNQLFDLGFIGSPFTWCNNQLGLTRRWARLDRVLANNSWLTKFDSYFNKHLSRTASDHSPLFLNARFFSHQKQKVFRFDNFWFEYDNCHLNVWNAWNNRPRANPMHAFSHSISKTRTLLCKWKTKELTPLEKHIQ